MRNFIDFEYSDESIKKQGVERYFASSDAFYSRTDLANT
jgi:hypothetical protein